MVYPRAMHKSLIQEAFKEISTTRNFSLLKTLAKPEKWGDIALEDRLLLAKLFIMQGKAELEKEDGDATIPFSHACQLSENSIEILFEVAENYAFHSTKELHLLLACTLSEKILHLDPSFFQAYHTWAIALVQLGVKKEQVELLHQAREKYTKGESNQSDKQYYWNWGVCLHYIAKQSGEAADYFQTIAKYQKAELMGMSGSLFWNDFGNALVDLACLISKTDFFVQASNYYHRVVEASPELYEGWFNLACTEEHLWRLKGEEKYFYSAHKCFEQASMINTEEPVLYFKWANHLAQTGKQKNSPKLIEASLDKFLKANTLHPDHAPILSAWAEAEMLLGVHEERLDYLKWAHTIIQRAIELDPGQPYHWVIFGRVLIELGQYFEEEQYFFQAIQKFKHGLTLHKDDPYLWYGLSVAHHAVGELKGDATFIEKALKYYSRAIEFDQEMTPGFWNEWGVCLIKMGEHTHDEQYIEAAVEKFEQCIRLYNLRSHGAPLSLNWLYNYGCALDYLGDMKEDEKYFERAIKVLSQALVLDPEHRLVKFHMALAFAHLGEMVSDVDCFEKALEIFDEVVTKEPEDEIAWHEWGLTLMHYAELVHDPAQLYFSSKLLKQAEDKFNQALALGNEFSLYFMACLYSMQGNFSLAMHYIERANQANVLPPLEDIIHDEWLKDLRFTNPFQQFLRQITRER